jgi:hypothetical protein
MTPDCLFSCLHPTPGAPPLLPALCRRPAQALHLHASSPKAWWMRSDSGLHAMLGFKHFLRPELDELGMHSVRGHFEDRALIVGTPS